MFVNCRVLEVLPKNEVRLTNIIVEVKFAETCRQAVDRVNAAKKNLCQNGLISISDVTDSVCFEVDFTLEKDGYLISGPVPW